MQTLDNISITAMHRWRLWIPGSLMIVAALGAFDPIASVTGLPSLVIESTAALIFVIVTFAMIRAGRCVRCKQNLILRSMTKENAGSWLRRFMEMKSCPCCGYPEAAHERR